MLRIFFAGQGKVAEAYYTSLSRYSDEITVAGVLTNRSRSHWWRSARIWERASLDSISTYSYEDSTRRNQESALAAHASECDVLLAVQHPWILPEEVLGRYANGALNLHTAPLPRYAGYNGYVHAVLDEVREFGATLHLMTPAVDRGDIIFADTFDVGSSPTAFYLYLEVIARADVTVDRLVDYLRSDLGPSQEVRVEDFRFFHRSSLDGLRRIPLGADIEVVDRMARAFAFPPFEPAYIQVDETRRLHVVAGGFLGKYGSTP